MIKSADNYLSLIRKSFKRFAAPVFLQAQMPRLFSLGCGAGGRPVSLPVPLVSFPGQRPRGWRPVDRARGTGPSGQRAISRLACGRPRFQAGPALPHAGWRSRRRRSPPPCAPRAAIRRPRSASGSESARRRSVRRDPAMAAACRTMIRWKPCASPSPCRVGLRDRQLAHFPIRRVRVWPGVVR